MIACGLHLRSLHTLRSTQASLRSLREILFYKEPPTLLPRGERKEQGVFRGETLYRPAATPPEISRLLSQKNKRPLLGACGSKDCGPFKKITCGDYRGE